MAELLTKRINQHVKGYNIENKVDLYLILEDQVIAIKPNNGVITIEKQDNYEHDYTTFGKPNTLVSVHDIVDKIEQPKMDVNGYPLFTSSHCIVLKDRHFQLIYYIYTRGDNIKSSGWQIDKNGESYEYKPCEYRWHVPNEPEKACN